MRAKLNSRRWGRVLFIAAVCVVVTAAYVAAQMGFFFMKGKLVPFADPTDSATNVVTINTHARLISGQVSPWHYHTGDVYMIVSLGTVTEDLGCGRTMQFPAGTVARTPVNTVHRVFNEDDRGGPSEAIFALFQVSPEDAPFNRRAPEPFCFDQ